MKKIIIPITTILLFGCSHKWDKEYAKKTCVDAATNANIKMDSEKKMIDKLCDCTAEKLVTNYKSEAEANKDTKAVEAISLGCIKELYSSPPAAIK